MSKHRSMHIYICMCACDIRSTAPSLCTNAKHMYKPCAHCQSHVQTQLQTIHTCSCLCTCLNNLNKCLQQETTVGTKVYTHAKRQVQSTRQICAQSTSKHMSAHMSAQMTRPTCIGKGCLQVCAHVYVYTCPFTRRNTHLQRKMTVGSQSARNRTRSA